MKMNTSRIWLGGIAGGVVWSIWSYLIGMKLAPFYVAEQAKGFLLPQPRYPLFIAQWLLLTLVISILAAHLYAWSRASAGAGPRTALRIGMIVGFFAGVPSNFAQAAWSPVSRFLPLGWMLDLWGGAILATLVAGWLYKEKA
ncbi:MAG: hypothetical protein HY010_18735 [Acidobacteria bacterium]|nr:hypothetical protein [Acidobacteriota bacterium]